MFCHCYSVWNVGEKKKHQLPGMEVVAHPSHNQRDLTHMNGKSPCWIQPGIWIQCQRARRGIASDK